MIATDKSVNCICDKATPTVFQKITQYDNYFQHLAHLCASDDDTNADNILLFTTASKNQGKETF